MPAWSDTQLKAIERYQGAVCVTAGAGAGKTGVIVEKFVRLVAEQKAEPDEILTITYTEKSAQELKRRIVKELEKRGLTRQRRMLEQAYIHTIHGVCRRLLAENPFEAGIDPQIAVMDERESGRLRQKAFDHAVKLAVQHGDAMDELLGAGLAIPMFQGNKDDMLFPLRTSIDSFIKRCRDYGLSINDLYNWINEEEIEVGKEWHRSISGYRDECLQTMLSLAGNEPELSEMIQLLIQNSQVDAVPVNQWITLNISHINNINKTATEKRIYPICNIANQLKQYLWGIKIDREKHCWKICSAYLSLAAETWSEYDQLKLKSLALDFEDLQQTTYKLFNESSATLKRYRDKFKYIMVDEFQDVNPIQAKIIQLITDNQQWMVVGDARQAIYGFRNADLTFFTQQVEDTQSNETTNPENWRCISLYTNYRSRPDILAFIGKLFGKIWRDDSYQSLTPGANYQTNSFPSVEIWINGIANRDEEMRRVAENIKNWVENKKFNVFDPTLNGSRPVSYGDIAILMRRFTHIEPYEQALRSADVPYFVVGGGRGYYTRYEVRDVTNLLRVIANPADDLAFASFLRSPFVGLSLDSLTLLAIKRLEKDRALYDQIRTPMEELPEDESRRLSEMLKWYEPLMTYSDRMPVYLLLEKALRDSQYEAKILCRPMGTQLYANIRKLLSIAVSTPDISLSEFIDKLTALKKLYQREGDAPTYDESADVVRISTIHGAKGLEYPVVILADINTPTGVMNNAFEFNPAKHQIGVNWREYETVACKVIREEKKATNHQEDMRLLYVAMTRAKERLVVSMSKEPKPGSWADRIRNELRLQTMNKPKQLEPIEDEFTYCVINYYLLTQQVKPDEY